MTSFRPINVSRDFLVVVAGLILLGGAIEILLLTGHSGDVEPGFGYVAVALALYGFGLSGQKAGEGTKESAASLLVTSLGAYAAAFALVAEHFTGDVLVGAGVVVAVAGSAAVLGYLRGTDRWFKCRFADRIGP